MFESFRQVKTPGEDLDYGVLFELGATDEIASAECIEVDATGTAVVPVDLSTSGVRFTQVGRVTWLVQADFSGGGLAGEYFVLFAANTLEGQRLERYMRLPVAVH
jgi:hypothetical protein